MPKMWCLNARVVATIAIFGAMFVATPRARADEPALTTPSIMSSSVAIKADEEDRILGKPDAPVTIYEYASMTCPHCAEFDKDTLPKIKEEWIQTGKAKLIFRDFPLDGMALRAATLARCAPPEKFYSFVDVLFRSQQSWEVSADQDAGLERIAKLGGMSGDQFHACMSDQKLQDKIAAMRLTAEQDYKVQSTPTFFINGKPIVGALPYESFDKALKDAEPRS